MGCETTKHAKKLIRESSMVTVIKFQTLLFFCSKFNIFVSGLEFTKFLSEKQTGKTLIRLLPQKQSDLGMHCLSRPFCQATSVRNFRAFHIACNIKAFYQKYHKNSCL